MPAPSVTEVCADRAAIDLLIARSTTRPGKHSAPVRSKGAGSVHPAQGGEGADALVMLVPSAKQ
jgi:hypothetical protein